MLYGTRAVVGYFICHSKYHDQGPHIKIRRRSTTQMKIYVCIYVYVEVFMFLCMHA